jgi:hypothetical protein
MGCARLTMPGGSRGWICGRGPRSTIKPCASCGEVSVLLCDGRHPTLPRTCDAPICEECAEAIPGVVGDDLDFHWCPECAIARRPIRGLSLWQPWAWAITAEIPNPKRTENRHKPPPRWLVGGYVALHAALKVDHGAIAELRREGIDCPLVGGLVRGAVTGVARVVGWVQPSIEPVNRWHNPERWGWQLDDVVRFHEPITATGCQGLWGLGWKDPHLAGAVRAAWKAAA